jgi:hypothetical protein
VTLAPDIINKIKMEEAKKKEKFRDSAKKEMPFEMIKEMNPEQMKMFREKGGERKKKRDN